MDPTTYYLLRQKSSGLYLTGFRIRPPLTKKGVLSKAVIIPKKVRRSCGYDPVYSECGRAESFYNITRLFETGLYHGCTLDIDDFELIAVAWHEVPHTKDLKKSVAEIEQEFLVRKLKHG